MRDFVRRAFNTIMRWGFRAPQGIECHTLVKTINLNQSSYDVGCIRSGVPGAA
jgi:hypothetical protein